MDPHPSRDPAIQQGITEIVGDVPGHAGHEGPRRGKRSAIANHAAAFSAESGLTSARPINPTRQSGGAPAWSATVKGTSQSGAHEALSEGRHQVVDVVKLRGRCQEHDAEEAVRRAACRSPSRAHTGCPSRAAGRARSPRRSCPAAGHLRHGVEGRHAAPRRSCRESRSARSVVSSARSRSAARNATWCDRSPVSAAVTAYCIGTGLHSRPSASFLIAAITSSSRGLRPTASQPARQPGAR